MAKSETTTIGACGEHYVSAYLSGFGLLVALPRAGIPGSDLFVAAVSGGRPIRVQVKTGTQAKRNTKWAPGEIYLWSTSCSVIERHDENLWYAYVWLNGWPEEGKNLPEVFFVPSVDVMTCMTAVREENKENPKAWTYFWMRADDAKKYKDSAGLKPLIDTLNR